MNVILSMVRRLQNQLFNLSDERRIQRNRREMRYGEYKRNIYCLFVNIHVMLTSQCNATFHSKYTVVFINYIYIYIYAFSF